MYLTWGCTRYTAVVTVKTTASRYNDNKITIFFFSSARLSTATANGTVTFFSKNFTNVLHWDAAEPKYPEEKLLYSVQYYR